MVFYHLRVGYRAGTGHSLPRCARGPQPSVPSPLPFRLSSECLWSWQSCGKYQNMQKKTKHTCTLNCTSTYVQKDLYDRLLFALRLEYEIFKQRYVQLLECLQCGQHNCMEERSVPDFISLKLCCWVLRPPTCPVSVFPVFSVSRTGSAFLLDTCTASHLPSLLLHVIQQDYYYSVIQLKNDKGGR